MKRVRYEIRAIVMQSCMQYIIAHLLVRFFNDTL